MCKSIWTTVVVATLATITSSGADPDEHLATEIGRAVATLPKVQTGRPGNLSQTSPAVLQSVIEELQSKPYPQLFAIKLSEDQASNLISCRGVDERTVSKLADAVLSAEDKKESMRAASVNSTIAISGGILAYYRSS